MTGKLIEPRTRSIVASVLFSLVFFISCAENMPPVKSALAPRLTKIIHEECGYGQASTFDVNGDGKIDLTQYKSADQKVLCSQADLNFDGQPDTFAFYDQAGLIRRREFDYGSHHLPTVIDMFEGGVLVRREMDLRGMGRIDTWETYDSKTGKRILREQDVDGDGRMDRWWSFLPDGNIRLSIDQNGDGIPDQEKDLLLDKNIQGISDSGELEEKKNKNEEEGKKRALEKNATQMPGAPSSPQHLGSKDEDKGKK